MQRFANTLGIAIGGIPRPFRFPEELAGVGGARPAADGEYLQLERSFNGSVGHAALDAN